MLHVSEIFCSVQGESRWSGFPCVFVRLAGCDLRCRWCDTAYALGPGREMSVEEILREIRSHRCRRVEVTGGEPLLQTESIELMKRLLEEGCEVLLETSGAHSIRDVPPGVVRILDVKCPGSGEAHRNLVENFQYLSPADDVKFVVLDRADFEYAVSVIREHHLEGLAGLIVSPVWGRVDLRELAAWLLASGLDARLQVPLHKIIWGPEARGV